MTTPPSLLYLSSQDVERACRELDPVELVRSALALHASAGTVLPHEARLVWDNGDPRGARSLNMPAFLGGPSPAVGTKVINSAPANIARRRPRASGLTLLFDPFTAEPVCVMDAADISARRTAAVTALAAELLAGRPIERLAFLGAGALADAHAGLLAERLPRLREIRVFDVDRERAERFAASSGARVAASAQEAVRDAELVVPVTTATHGYIALEWLARGALLVNVSLDDPLPEVILEAGKLIVDDWEAVKHDSTRLLGRLYRRGLVAGPDGPPAPGARRVDAELGDVVVGARAGRSHDDEIVVVNPFGLAIEDLAIAREAYAVARRSGLGVTLEP